MKPHVRARTIDEFEEFHMVAWGILSFMALPAEGLNNSRNVFSTARGTAVVKTTLAHT